MANLSAIKQIISHNFRVIAFVYLECKQISSSTDQIYRKLFTLFICTCRTASKLFWLWTFYSFIFTYVSPRTKYRKIPKIRPGPYIFQRPFLRGLPTEGNLCFKIHLVSLIVGRKFTVLLCFTLYLRAISKYKPLGVLYLEGWFNKGFFCFMSLGALYLEGLIHGGANFRNFRVFSARVMSLCACVHHTSSAWQQSRHQSLQIRLWLRKNRCAIVWSACDNST